MRKSGTRATLAAFVAVVGLGLTTVACSDDGGSTSTPKTTSANTSGGNGGGSTANNDGGGGGDAAAGKDLFASSCASCHGPDAKGLAGLGKDLVTSEFAKGLSDQELVAFITKGRDANDPLNTTGVAMPPKGGNPALTEKQLQDIVSYLRELEA